MVKKGLIMAGILAMLASLFSSCSAGEEQSKRPSRNRPIKDEVMSISWISSGDSLGCHYERSLEKQENGQYIAVVHNQPTHSDKPKITKVKVTEYDLNALFNHIQKNYEYKKWKEYPKSELMVLDAASSSVHISMMTPDGYKNYSLSDTKKIPDGQAKVFFDIKKFIESYAANNAKIVTISRSGFDGNPNPESLEIDNSGMIRVDYSKKYSNPDSREKGRPFKANYVFHGRIPGETKLRFTSSISVEPLEYKAVVDKEFNLTLEKIK